MVRQLEGCWIRTCVVVVVMVEEVVVVKERECVWWLVVVVRRAGGRGYRVRASEIVGMFFEVELLYHAVHLAWDDLNWQPCEFC